MYTACLPQILSLSTTYKLMCLYKNKYILPLTYQALKENSPEYRLQSHRFVSYRYVPKYWKNTICSLVAYLHSCLKHKYNNTALSVQDTNSTLYIYNILYNYINSWYTQRLKLSILQDNAQRVIFTFVTNNK